MVKICATPKKSYIAGKGASLWFDILRCVGNKSKFYSTIFPQNFSIFWYEKDPNETLVDFSGVHQHKMAFKWREREHEEHDLNATNVYATIKALRNHGLLKFFSLPSMR